MQVEQRMIALPAEDIFELARVGVEGGQVILQKHALAKQARGQLSKKVLDRRPKLVALALILSGPVHG
jgi:hypothetical protein